jgi:putative transposase
VLSALP